MNKTQPQEIVERNYVKFVNNIEYVGGVDTSKLAGRSYSRETYNSFNTFTGYPLTIADGEEFNQHNSIESKKDDFKIVDGIIRWISNGSIPFGDMLLDYLELGVVTPTQVMDSCKLREEETDLFWKEYAENPNEAVKHSFGRRCIKDLEFGKRVK